VDVAVVIFSLRPSSTSTRSIASRNRLCSLDRPGRPSLTENYITDAMREDWEANRDALMAFWRSGKYSNDLAEFGINVRMKPWLFFCGSRKTLPWAALQFDRGSD
jgi:hypothetical protein